MDQDSLAGPPPTGKPRDEGRIAWGALQICCLQKFRINHRGRRESTAQLGRIRRVKGEVKGTELGKTGLSKRTHAGYLCPPCGLALTRRRILDSIRNYKTSAVCSPKRCDRSSHSIPQRCGSSAPIAALPPCPLRLCGQLSVARKVGRHHPVKRPVAVDGGSRRLAEVTEAVRPGRQQVAQVSGKGFR